MKVLILMAGPQRVKGINEPPALLSHHGKTIIELLSQKLDALGNISEVISVIKASDAKDFHLDNICKLSFENPRVIKISGPTQGAACSALMAIDEIDSEEDLLILSGDEYLDICFSDAIQNFKKLEVDGGVVTFESVHPSFSYALINSESEVEMVTEKNPISKNALAGFWYFRRGSEFVEAAKNTIRKDAAVKGSYFVSPAFNELILKGRRIGTFKIAQENYFPLKNDMQVQSYLEDT